MYKGHMRIGLAKYTLRKKEIRSELVQDFKTNILKNLNL